MFDRQQLKPSVPVFSRLLKTQKDPHQQRSTAQPRWRRRRCLPSPLQNSGRWTRYPQMKPHYLKKQDKLQTESDKQRRMYVIQAGVTSSSPLSNLSLLIPRPLWLKPTYFMGDWAVTYGVSHGLTAYNSMYIINYPAVRKRFTVWAAVSTCQELVELNQEVKWNIYFKAAIIHIFYIIIYKVKVVLVHSDEPTGNYHPMLQLLLALWSILAYFSLF